MALLMSRALFMTCPGRRLSMGYVATMCAAVPDSGPMIKALGEAARELRCLTPHCVRRRLETFGAAFSTFRLSVVCPAGCAYYIGYLKTCTAARPVQPTRA